MLNFNNKGVPIATIKNDKNKAVKTIYLDDSAATKTPLNKPGYVTKPLCEFCGRDFYGNRELLRHQAKSCQVKKLFDLNNKNDIIDHNLLNNDSGMELKIEQGKIFPLPNKKLREIVYIAGPQGSGKSYYASEYIKELQKMFPKKKIVVFSRILEDKALSNIKNKYRYDLNDDLLENRIEPKIELNNTCVLFDDIEQSINKDMQKYLEDLRDDIIKNGRDQTEKGNDIYCICTSHQVTDYVKTRDILNECTSITIFPKSGSTYGIKRALKCYCGLGEKDIDKILNLDSRWVTIYKRYPMYCVYEKGIYLLSK
jgi:hypothetical protein